MAISFPRNMPSQLEVVGMSFMLKPMLELSPLRSGRQIAKDLGPSLWVGSWRSIPLEEGNFGIVRAWFDTVSSTQMFYGFDKLREYPYAYRDTHWAGLTYSGSPFDGSGRLVSVESNNVELNLSFLPSGFVLSPGDYFAFFYGSDSIALHRVVATATADAGGLMRVEVRPHVRAGWVTLSTVYFYQAVAKMLVIPESFTETVEPIFSTVSFQAIQSL